MTRRLQDFQTIHFEGGLLPSLAKPKSWMEPTVIREADGQETPLPTYAHHLLADEQGQFPVDLNTWETTVLQTEMARPDFLAWYRNPPRASGGCRGLAQGSRCLEPGTWVQRVNL
jgi:hypothetical protein